MFCNYDAVCVCVLIIKNIFNPFLGQVVIGIVIIIINRDLLISYLYDQVSQFGDCV